MNIAIELLGADARFRASIAQFLKLKSKDRFVLADKGTITLIDADSIEGKKALQKHLDDHTIILSVMPEQWDHPYFVKKPIKIDELMAVLEKVAAIAPTEAIAVEEAPHETIADAQATGNPFAKFLDPSYMAKHKAGQNVFAKIAQNGAAAPEAPAEPASAKLDYQLFSTWQDELTDRKGLTKYTYDNYLEQTAGKDLYDSSCLYGNQEECFVDMADHASVWLFEKVLKMDKKGPIYYFDYLDGIVFIFADGIVLSNLAVERLHDFSKATKDEIVLKAVASEAEFLSLLNRYEQYSYGDALGIMCRAVLMGANGRIINGKDIKEPLGLMKHDGQAKMVLTLPHAKEMENIWRYRNVSLRDTAELLTEVNPYHIFSYYTMCDLYGYFDRKVEDHKNRNQLDLNTLLSELQKL
ncbi:hypothetical protein B9T21_03635 [Wohlfahrtiimonas chitiniclastica]|uniref:hypothetical protein n=1 Tax=Wohlfahrtiimonas chitiniclastica TaxID=400946 RepID=UPI000B988F08|nr:hypothetical protein [Wohlfahrtiimonas chitiniclastica]OYQ88393.1 hypothetical protein B9T21_03635 [Wohlfahrtiimonas chitiniclastica]